MGLPKFGFGRNFRFYRNSVGHYLKLLHLPYSDSEDTEDDPELLDELAEFAQDEEITEEEDVGEHHDTHGCAGESLLAVIDERMKMYANAEKKAKSAGESSRARRFARGLATLSDQRKRLKDGKSINESDIPLAIGNVAGSSAPPQHQPSAPHDHEKQAIVQPQENQLVKELQQKRSQYREAALNAKKDGDKSRAALGLQGVKQCDELLQRLKNGGGLEGVDLASVLPPLTAPAPPPPLARTFSRDDPIGNVELFVSLICTLGGASKLFV